MLSYQKFTEKSHFFCLCCAIIIAIVAPISTAITSVGCVLMLVAWLFSGKVLASLTIAYQQATGKMILIFFVWLVIGTFYAETSWHDKVDTLLSWKKFAYLFILLGLFHSKKWKGYFIHSYVSFMSLAALIGIVLWQLNIVVREGAGHDAGIFMTNYATQSTAFIAALLACIFLRHETTSTLKKQGLSLAIALFIINIFFISGARTAYFALPIAVVFAVGSLYGYKKLPIIMALASVFVLLLVVSSSTLQQRVDEGLKEFNSYDSSPHISSIGVRVIFAKNTVELIKQRPLWGYGTSSFESTYGEYAASHYQGWRALTTTDPHNIYLYISLENGLMGLLIFLIYLYVAFRQGLQQDFYGKLAVSFLMTITVASLFNAYFKTFPEGHLLAFFMGILLAYKPALLLEKNTDA
ncbi:MAG: O-antigen ligase family protein [Methylococcales bacterium]|nr:O-antigen ligase family protein [Methylococcales bacterium]